MVAKKQSTLQSTTLRDFSGGWNVADSDMNLSSKYQPISENIMRGTDGSFYPRWGYKLFADLETGTSGTWGSISLTMTTTVGSPVVSIARTAHGLASGDHVTISGVAAALNGIPASDLNRTHHVLVVDANNFKIYTRTNATVASSVAVAGTYSWDKHIGGGNIIHSTYFNRRLVLFTSIGEVITVDANGTIVRLWSSDTAFAISPTLVPNRWCDLWSSDTFKSSVIICNGYNNDKPLQLTSSFVCQPLVDKASLSNAAVPRADYVLCMQGYVIFLRTEYGDTFAEFSAKGTDGTFTREALPADAVEIDLSTQTSTVEPVILGGSRIRDKMYAAFYDRGMIGTLGTYDDLTPAHHVPDFKDTIAENGTIGHRTIVSLGNDIFLCDYAGVPSVSISETSGIFVPIRLSELISPAIQKHLAALSEDTLRNKAFAFYSKTDRAYMLFLPKYDVVAAVCVSDPIILTESLTQVNRCIVLCTDHGLIERSNVVMAGVANMGVILGSMINGTRKVVRIINKDAFVIETGTLLQNTGVTGGGGSAVTMTPVNDETICYAFEYNKELKIRRWTRYRGMNFDTGCISQRGKVFLSKGLRVYKMGDNEEPVYADFVGNYDDKAWATSHAYTVSRRVRDAVDGLTYKCLVAHTSAASGTFSADRILHPTYWEEYVGEPIDWELETPWSDLRMRDHYKINKYIMLDTEGTDRFEVSCFADEIRINPETYDLLPQRTMMFNAGDTGGYSGATPQTFSSGRRTREQTMWGFPVRGKLLRWRWAGQTTRKVRIISHTQLFRPGSFR